MKDITTATTGTENMLSSEDYMDAMIKVRNHLENHSASIAARVDVGQEVLKSLKKHPSLQYESGQIGSCFAGIPIFMDPTLPPDAYEFRNKDGRVISRGILT